MTSALEGVANGVTTLNGITSEINNGDVLRQNISQTDIRPFSEMRAITSQIQSTSISADSVAKTFDSATAGLQVAQEALNISNAAS